MSNYLAILGVITYICNLSFASAKRPCLEADRPIGKSLPRGRERKFAGVPAADALVRKHICKYKIFKDMKTSKKDSYLTPQAFSLPLEPEDVIAASGNIEDYTNEDFNWED